MYFHQIIFPSKPKPKELSSDNYDFEYWIVGGTTKELWVKCPICHYAYKTSNLLSREEVMRNYLEEYKPYHYRKTIRMCPKNLEHIGETCQNILKK